GGGGISSEGTGGGDDFPGLVSEPAIFEFSRLSTDLPVSPGTSGTTVLVSKFGVVGAGITRWVVGSVGVRAGSCVIVLTGVGGPSSLEKLGGGGAFSIDPFSPVRDLACADGDSGTDSESSMAGAGALEACLSRGLASLAGRTEGILRSSTTR